MLSARRPRRGPSARRRTWAATTTAAVALSVAGFAATPAQSAPDASCPDAFPVSGAVRGLDVHGLTVLQGTDPEQFTGTVLGVLEDGIAPGLPMIMVDVTSANVADIGIWQGMSGSPVYAPDGRLIGAVAYGLAAGPSSVAGVTPAADMQELLADQPAPAPTLRTKVALPRTMARRIVASGAASPDEVSGGMKRLKLPFGISGFGTDQRRAQLAKALGVKNVNTMAAGATSTADEEIPIVAGGNLAASISYGDVTAAGIGTATAVCGQQVLAFGHPMTFSGDSTMTMHGADAVFVQKDPTFAGFKVANLGAPVGAITGDHLAGLAGLVGTAPGTSVAHSKVTVGTKSREGTTRISVKEAVPDLAIAHVVADQDRVLDAIGKGSGTLSYTVRFLRQDGRAQQMTRTDIYADPADISYGDVWDLADLLYTLGYNGLEDVTVTSVDTTSVLTHTYSHYLLSKVQIRRHGAWHTLNPDRTLRLRQGSTARFRTFLTSPDLGPRVVRSSVTVPRHAVGKFGALQVFGGNSGGMEEGGDVYAEGKAAASDSAQPTLDDLLTGLRRTPHNDDVVVDMTWFDQEGNQTNHRRAKTRTGHVVDGSFSMSVRGVR